VDIGKEVESVVIEPIRSPVPDVVPSEPREPVPA